MVRSKAYILNFYKDNFSIGETQNVVYLLVIKPNKNTPLIHI